MQRMRTRGETKRSIAGALGKHRVQLVKYINAYVIPLEAGVVAGARAVLASAPALPLRRGRRRRRRIRLILCGSRRGWGFNMGREHVLTALWLGVVRDKVHHLGN